MTDQMLFRSVSEELLCIPTPEGMIPKPIPDEKLLIVLPEGILLILKLDKVGILLPDAVAPAEAAVNDTTNNIANKILVVFLILSIVCFPILFHSPKFTCSNTI